MISSQLLILGYNDLSALIMGTNHRHPNSAIVQALATSPNVIVAPAAIARFIALSCPELTKKDTLRLLIVGAGMVDTIDEGRWFHFIPLLCGADFEVETTLVGPDCQRPPMKSPGAPMLSSLPAAETHYCVLSESSVDPSLFDVIVLFHPGFLLYPQWFDAGGLQKITSAQKPVMVTSFNPEEQDIECRLLMEYGYQTAVLCDNPINIPSPHYPDKWGSSIWQLSGSPYPVPPDPEKIAELTLTAEMLVRSRTAVYGPCERVSIGNVPLVHIAAGHFVDPKDGECFFIQGKYTYDAGSLSSNELATMPDEDAPLVDRLLWGAKLQRART